MMMIRSQDKKRLIPLDKPIYVGYNNKKAIFSSYGVDGIKIGEYSSESRCIEIMDEIQTEIKHQNYNEIQGLTNGDYGVYQMPEK